MNFLNTAYRQVLELFGSMTPAARVTTGLLLAVMVVSMAYLFRSKTESPQHLLFGTRLTHREISALEVAFSQADLNSWKIEGNQILVPPSERHSYLAAAHEYEALPESSNIIWDNVFENTSPLDTRSIQEGKEKQAKQKGLSLDIRDIDRIEEASVTIVEKQTNRFPRRTENTALAIVRAAGNRALDAELVKTVRYAVAAAGGLDSRNVTVVDASTGLSYPGHGKDGPPLLEENVYAENQRRFEESYRSKIEGQLAMIPGVRVAVFVELDKNLQNQTSSRQYEQGVSVRTKEFKKEAATANPTGGGRVGAVANGAVGNTSQTVAATTSNNTSSEEGNETEQLPATTQTYTQTAGLVPTLVKASISVPTSYFEKVWREQNPTPPGADPLQPDPTALTRIKQDELTKIETIVKTILPEPPPGDDPFPRVSVDTYTETPLPPLEKVGVGATATTWLGSNWQTLGMFILALVGVVMLRSMILSAQTAALANTEEHPLSAERLAALEKDDIAEDESEDDFSNSLKARFQNSGRSLRSELSELVREDPDAAANVLQNWIGDAA